MSRHSDTVYLRHMLDAAETAMGLAKGRQREDLEAEPMLRYSLLHLTCILGEAANRVSPTGRSTHPQIPWRDMIDMRNMLIHGYDVVDLDMLWDTVTTDLLAVSRSLREALGGIDAS